MTTMMALLLFSLFALMVVEMALYFIWPAALSRLACLPILEHQVKLKAPEELLASKPSGYRSSAVRSLSMSDLTISPPGHTPNAVVGWLGQEGWLRLHYKWIGFNKSLAVARVTTHLEGDTVTLKAHGLPIPLSVFLYMGLWALHALSTTGGNPVMILVALVISAAVIGLTLMLAKNRLKPEVRRMLFDIESNIRFKRAPHGHQATIGGDRFATFYGR